MSEIFLGYDYPVVDDHIRAVVFGELVKLATPVVKHYVSDLFHDAGWLREYLSMESPTFFYGVRESGTSIGTDESLVTAYNTVTWELRIENDGRKVMLHIIDRVRELSV